MASAGPDEIWDLWYPQAASTGMPFARGRVSAAGVLIVHAAPGCLAVEVRDPDGRRLAYGKDLPGTGDCPMAFLTRRADQIEREDRWPTQADIGRLVILPGGEVGNLRAWWNAEDGSAWRWQVEFYNRR